MRLQIPRPKNIPSAAEECAYGGASEDLTRDHVPPKCFFAADSRKGLITVKACRACNNAFSRDDDYFHLVLCLRGDLSSDPRVKPLRASRRRAIKRRPALYEQLLRSAKLVNSAAPSGIIIGPATVIKPEKDRMLRVIERITRGLFYREFSQRVPPGYYVYCDALFHVMHRADSELRSFRALMDKIEGAIDQRGDGAFVWTQKSAIDDPFTPIWTFQFFERVAFGALVSEIDFTR